MIAKLDENLRVQAIELFQKAGYDIETVVGEDLGGASDEDLTAVCGAEGRILITLDLDFANVLRFPPSCHAGIVVLRLPHPVELGAIHDRIENTARSGGKGRTTHREVVDRGAGPNSRVRAQSMNVYSTSFNVSLLPPFKTN